MTMVAETFVFCGKIKMISVCCELGILRFYVDLSYETVNIKYFT